MKKSISLEHIEEQLAKSDIKISDQTMPALEQVAVAHGFDVHGIYADVSHIEGLSSLATVVTYTDQTGNDGSYLFCVQDTGAIGLMVVEPSTISKGPMINRVVGDISSAITGVDIPPLTAFDNVEIVGDLVKKLVLDPMMDALAIPEDSRDLFVTIYLPRFLSNVALQYLGSPDFKEENVDLEPHMVRAIVLNDKKEFGGDEDVSKDA